MSKKQLPEPKPRKHPHLWQTYLWWDELTKMRMRHDQRISAVERGVSNMDAQFERDMLEHLQLDEQIDYARKAMIRYGKAVGPIWDASTSIKGFGGRLAASMLAQIDDIGRFDTVSKLWRFAGWAVIDGKREHNVKGNTSHYNRRLKAICHLVAEQFVRHQTPGYVDVYYAEKARLRKLYPEPVKAPKGSAWPYLYTDSHIDRMARRKMIKLFLSHLWVMWRTYEGLPTRNPYAHEYLGHTTLELPAAYGWPDLDEDPE